MFRNLRIYALLALGLSVLLTASSSRAQLGNSGSIVGIVTDPSGAAVGNATVEISYPVSGYKRSATTGNDGSFKFTNVPFNGYHMVVTATGFDAFTQDVEVRSAVPTNVQIALKIGTEVTSVTVETNGGDLIETESTFHTDVDRQLFEKLPLESSSAVSTLVTLVTPGVAADSNGLFHGLGDHAENSFSVDGQPITDQQSKVFSNQIPSDSIQDLEVISGAPPAEFGGKTSLVIKATTRSGLGVTTPTGSVYSSYGSFGTVNAGFSIAYGGQKWGNFAAANGLNTSRFLDPPEQTPLHDRGNEENVFDRFDYQLNAKDTLHLNLQYTRSWFQQPNTYDQQLHTCSAGFTCNAAGQALDPNGALMGATDPRSQIQTFNIAPSYTKLVNTNTLFTLGAFIRKDQYNFYPSQDPFADFSPDLDSQTLRQDRRLTNVGLRSDISYVKGIHNIKAGATFEHTFLAENDRIGTVDPGFSALFNQLDANGNPISNPANPGTFFNCAQALQPNEIGPCQTLASVDLTNGGRLFTFQGHTDIKEVALYVQDTITKGSWSFNLGLREDLYHGITHNNQAEPRLGIAYNIKSTNTVLRLSYARTLESPFNENLIIASEGCADPVIAVLVPPPNIPCNGTAIQPGFRNEFHAGLQQAFGKFLVVDAEYIWKYTHNGYDFGVVASTPVAFPIEWHNAKIPGFALSARVPDFHGFTALVSMSSVAARFFNPQIGGVPFLPATNVFRIDHDERFNQTTHLQYQPWKKGPWFGFNWRYDSGLVAGAVPCFAPTPTCGFSTVPGTGGAGEPPALIALVNNATGLPLTADQEFQAQLTCNGQLAAPSPTGPALATCPAATFGSRLISIPGVNKENDDHDPQRIAPRNLFDASVGHDNIFGGDRFKWSLRFTVINLTNKVALYNFFSTFSGTHYVTPRTETAELAFHF